MIPMISESTVLQANKSHFSDEQLKKLAERPLPRHVAIIMDGNRRWAEKYALTKLGGHWRGAHVLTQIVEAAAELGIRVLTVFAFSTENWKRAPKEVETLLKIFESYLKENCQKMVNQGVRFHVIGDTVSLPSSLKKAIERTSLKTSKGERIDFVVALNYGGRDEICRIVKKIVAEVERGALSRNEINESCIASYSDTFLFGDPDLLIRTSGEHRISNFLLWQLAYTEVYITETLWPAFTPFDLFLAILDFQNRQRRNGK